MNKFFLGFMMLVMVGCTSDNEASLRAKIKDLRETNETLESQLNSCQAKLDFARPLETSSAQQQEPATQEPSEPQYEEVDVYYVDSTKCYKTDESGSVPACGRGFWECGDHKVRECLTNVKYEIKTEKKLVEE